MTPKSLLRHPEATSDLEAFTEGTFQRVLADNTADDDPGRIQRVLLCSGKVYYDLLERREELGREDVAIVRLEQLYPFPSEPLRAALAHYAEDISLVWVQEEPRNMGAWPYLRWIAHTELFHRFDLTGITRETSASPATGSSAAHKQEQQELVDRAFGTG
ncbi:MAG: 2-oxoglutarate dehydrogenase E1 component, partial [Phycisphaeraceae bacterium]|nr:2-oxoglutarate dehydrogenase E1 component [Phycisphaeraceae bacterium]